MAGPLDLLMKALKTVPQERAWWLGLPERASHVVHPPLTHDEWIQVPENAKKLGMTFQQLMNAPQGVATARVMQPHALDLVTLGGGLTKEELRALTEIVQGMPLPQSVSKVRLGTPETTYAPVDLQEFLAARSPRDLRKGMKEGGPVKMQDGGSLNDRIAEVERRAGSDTVDRYSRQKQKAATARQLSDTPRGPLADPQFLQDVMSTVVGTTPAEVAMNVAMGVPGVGRKAAGMGIAALLGADDAEAGGLTKMLQGLYRGYAGPLTKDAVYSASPQKKVADYYAKRRATELGMDPHAEMLLVEQGIPTDKALGIPIDTWNKESGVVTQSKKVLPEQIQSRTKLYADGGPVNLNERVAALAARCA